MLGERESTSLFLKSRELRVKTLVGLLVCPSRQHDRCGVGDAMAQAWAL